MTDASPRRTARHSHLVRAAHSAGEVFAYTSAEGESRGREGARVAAALWIGVGALAALGLFLAI